MKAPATAIRVRWRPAGTDSWAQRDFAIGAQISIPDIVRENDYEVEAQTIGAGGLNSAWVSATVSIPATIRSGVAALPVVAVGNVPSRWVAGTEVTYTSTETTATISVSAGVLQVGPQQITYAASSLALTGVANEIRNLWLYYDDFRLAGGSRTLGATTDTVQSMASAGRILIVPLQVKFAAPGGTGGGGGDIGGGGGGGGGRPPIFDTELE